MGGGNLKASWRAPRILEGPRWMYPMTKLSKFEAPERMMWEGGMPLGMIL